MTVKALPTAVYSIEQIKAIEHLAITEQGIPALELMQRAGKAAFQAFLDRYWPSVRTVAILCGAGNNAGDGYVFARQACKAGLEVCVYYLTDPSLLGEPAYSAAQAAIKTGVTLKAYIPGMLLDSDVIVDALLGTGLTREVSAEYFDAINACNASDVPVLAIDVPSGLDADKGCVCGAAIHADATITFIGMKSGLLTGPDAKDYCGQLICDDLGISSELQNCVSSVGARMTWEWYADDFRARSRVAHKGDFGHVLIMGGNKGMPGSVRLAGEAALRVGAGLVSIATRPEHAVQVIAGRPELMSHGVLSREDLNPLLSRASVLVLGNGLGQDDWAQMLWSAAMDSGLPMLVDADGLNLLAKHKMQRQTWILTPHPGEASRLLGVDVKAIQADRMQSIDHLQRTYGGTVVLKGAGTLVKGFDSKIFFCDRGNPGMASAGMGDALSGVIAGLLAQGFTLDKAAQAGVFLHALAADAAAKISERGLLAMDLIHHLRDFLGAS